MADGTGREPSLEEHQPHRGRRPGDRYVRIVRPAEFRRGRGGTYVATERALAPRSRVGRAYEKVRRVVFGRRLETEAEAEERLSKRTGLGVLASDNISSSAYATEEAMRVLALAGAGALALTMPVAVAIAAVLGIVVLSQTQVIRTYPGGGGSYAVTKAELGAVPGLVVAAALLVDYVLTVAVSTAAGVAAIGSFVPAVHDERVVVGLVLIVILAIGNLRGVREAGILFSAPTYLYLVAMGGLLLYGAARLLTGTAPVAVLAPDPFPPSGTEALGLLLVLRAFASGSAALTGAEAVANGTPSLKPPEARNGVVIVILMGTLFGVIFLGLSLLAMSIGAVPDMHEQETLNSIVTRSFVGTGAYYYLVQIATAIILVLAANTGYTGFPRLASVLADDRFMPRQFSFRGERLALSFGIVSLALLAAVVLAAFGGSVTALIPLYTIGVFIAFTLAQAGLIRRWIARREAGWRWRLALNLVGVTATAVTLAVVTVTKFERGAWVVLIVMPALVALLYAIHSHYRSVSDTLTPTFGEALLRVPARPLAIVPVARLDRAAIAALGFALSISDEARAVHVATSEETGREFRRRWLRWSEQRGADERQITLDVVVSPYRVLIPPLVRYVDRMAERTGGLVAVVVTEVVPGHWWEFVLHSQTAFQLKLALLFRPNAVVVDVPYRPATPILATRPPGRAGPSEESGP